MTLSITAVFATLSVHDTLHNDIDYNDTRQIAIDYNDTQHNDTDHAYT